MANSKKSFLLHIDSLDILDDLDDNQSGLLFKAIKAYQKDEQIELDGIVKIAFSPFKNQFIRDDEKYKKTCERRSLAGSKGGKKKQANLAKATNCKQYLAKVSDNKNKTNNDSDNDKEDIKPSVDKSTKYNFNDEDLRFAEWFQGKLLELNPKHPEPSNYKKWADDIRKIRTIDKKTHEEMSDLFLWVCADNFWCTNILSPSKFRKQWGQLAIKMNNGPNDKRRDINAIGTDFSAPEGWNND